MVVNYMSQYEQGCSIRVGSTRLVAADVPTHPEPLIDDLFITKTISHQEVLMLLYILYCLYFAQYRIH